MKLLLDMNLSPSWVDFLGARGIEAVHWSSIGDVCAEDRVILQWARAHDHILFTNDLDFTALLAASGATSPSVLQLRAQSLLPSDIGEIVLGVLERHAGVFAQGAFVTVDEAKARVRILPLRNRAPREGGD